MNLTTDEIADIFAQWNDGPLDSYLMEISVEVLRHKTTDNIPLVDLILDKAGQKGTGLWTAVSSLEVGAQHQPLLKPFMHALFLHLKTSRYKRSHY